MNYLSSGLIADSKLTYMKNRGSAEGKLEQLLKSYVVGYPSKETSNEKNEFADKYIIEMGKPGSYVTGRPAEQTVGDVIMVQIGTRFDQFSKDDKIDFYSEMIANKVIPNVSSGKFTVIGNHLTYWKTAYFNLLKTKANNRSRDVEMFVSRDDENEDGSTVQEKSGSHDLAFEFSKPFDFIHLQAVFFGLFFLPKKYKTELFEEYCIKLKYFSDKVAVERLMEIRNLPESSLQQIKRSYKDNTTSPDYKASNLFNTSARQQGYDYQHGSMSERKADKPLHGRSLIIRGILRHLFVDFKEDHRAIELTEKQLENLLPKVNKPALFNKEGAALKNPSLNFPMLMYATYAVYHELVDVLKMEDESDERGQSLFFESLKAEMNSPAVQSADFIAKFREVLENITSIDV